MRATRHSAPEQQDPEREVTPGAAWLVALALIVCVLALMPWAGWLGFDRLVAAEPLTRVAVDWILWTGLIVGGAILISTFGRGRLRALERRWTAAVSRLPATRYALAAAVLTLTLAVTLAHLAFEGNPHHVDSIAQLFHARIFAGLHLTAPAPAHYEFFAATNLVTHDGRWLSQYPPGHVALLALGWRLGVPWLVGPLATAGTALLLFGAARRLLGDVEARLSTVLFAVSPFALMMGASYMNHATATLFHAAALYATVRTLEGGGAWGVVVGLALAAGALVRPLEAVAWASVLGLWILFVRGWRTAGLAALACGIGLLPLLAYNAATTGAPLRFGYTLLWGAEHGLGFHTDPWGHPFTPTRALAQTAADFRRLNRVLFGWPFPSLVFVIVALVAAGRDRRLRRSAGPLALLLVAVPVAYAFYWHRDAYLGPRFLHASLVPAVLLTGIGIRWVDRHTGGWRSAFRTVVLAAVLFGATVTMPEWAGTVAGRTGVMKLHPETELERIARTEGLILVDVGWGSRLIARLWAWGIRAPQAERAFHAVDGCRLQLALDRADSLSTAGRDSARVRQWLENRLVAWERSELPVTSGALPDPTVRVDTTRALARSCVPEARRDLDGFTAYGNLIWRNDPWLESGFIYARDMGPARNARIKARYPDRPHFRYEPESPDPGARPVLRRLEHSTLDSRPGRRETRDD